MAEDDHGHVELLAKQTLPIERGLLAGLRADPSETDKRVMTDAIRKAAIEGAKVGAMVMYARKEENPEANPMQIDWELPPGDPLAEQFDGEET